MTHINSRKYTWSEGDPVPEDVMNHFRAQWLIDRAKLIDQLDSFLEMRIAAEFDELRADFEELKKDLETIHAMNTLRAAVGVSGPELFIPMSEGLVKFKKLTDSAK